MAIPKENAKAVARAVLIGLVLLLGAARMVYYWNRPSDAEVQARMQEGYKHMQAFHEAEERMHPERFPFSKRTITEEERKALAALANETPEQRERRKANEEQDRAKAKAVIDAFLKEVLAGNLQAAYRMTTADFKVRVGQEYFESMARNPAIQGSKQCRILGGVLASPTVWEELSGPPDPNTATTIVNITVAKEDGLWAVFNFTVGQRNP